MMYWLGVAVGQAMAGALIWRRGVMATRQAMAMEVARPRRSEVVMRRAWRSIWGG
jgi:hypothetical protein